MYGWYMFAVETAAGWGSVALCGGKGPLTDPASSSQRCDGE